MTTQRIKLKRKINDLETAVYKLWDKTSPAAISVIKRHRNQIEVLQKQLDRIEAKDSKAVKFIKKLKGKK